MVIRPAAPIPTMRMAGTSKDTEAVTTPPGLQEDVQSISTSVPSGRIPFP